MLPHDNSLDQAQNRSPASFWISHPNNVFLGNVAADSPGVGYWFALHEFPTGTSSNGVWGFSGTNATLENLGVFALNVAHSIKMGIDINDSVRDQSGAIHPMNSCLPATPPVYCAGGPPAMPSLGDPSDDDVIRNRMWRPGDLAVFDGFLAYGCTTGFYSGGGVDYVGAVRCTNSVFIDNGAHLHLASAEIVSNSLLVHDSGNGIFPVGASYIHGFERGNAYVVYDGPGELYDSYLVGYRASGAGYLYYSDFGAARRHTGHRIRGLTFAGSGPINVGFRNFDPLASGAPAVLGYPHVWGIAIIDEDGSLTNGTQLGKTLVSNHKMMRVRDAVGNTVDKPLGPNSVLSLFDWGHLQVRGYDGGVPGALMESGSVPPVEFIRWPFSSHGFNWLQESHDYDIVLNAQMRQLPVLVGDEGTPQCVYEVVLDIGSSVQRVDITLDDVQTGATVHLLVKHPTQPVGWSPQVKINDEPTLIHKNGQNPNLLPALTPGIVAGQTSYRIRTLGTENVVELVMANPATPVPDGRTHRVSLVW